MDKQTDKLDVELRAVDRLGSRTGRTIELLRHHGIRGIAEKIHGAGGLKAFAERQMRIPILQFLSKRWDRKYNVDTRGLIEMDDVEVVGPNKEGGYTYVGSSPSIFRFVSKSFPPNWKDYTFVDVGCGKGRAVMLASLHGFDVIQGIEFAPLIAQVGAQNLIDFSGRKPSSWSIVNADATTASFPLGRPLLVYCYSPFKIEVWEKFLPALAKTREANNNMPMCLVLVGTPAAADLIRDSGMFRETARGMSPFYMDAYATYPFWIFQTT